MDLNINHCGTGKYRTGYFISTDFKCTFVLKNDMKMSNIRVYITLNIPIKV